MFAVLLPLCPRNGWLNNVQEDANAIPLSTVHSDYVTTMMIMMMMMIIIWYVKRHDLPIFPTVTYMKLRCH